MMTKLKTGAVAMVLVGLLGWVAWLHQEIKSLRAEGNYLREQLAQAASLQEAHERLVQQFKKAGEDLQEDQRELVRLRGQSSRLHQLGQENAQLKARLAQMTAQVTQARPMTAAAEVPPRVAPTDAPAGTSSAAVTDLGLVELADRVPQRLSLGMGKECIVTATGLPDGNLQMSFISTSEIDGVPIQSEKTQTLPAGKQIATVIDGAEVTLTPTLKAK